MPNLNKVPRVTRKDVVRVVHRDFRPQSVQTALRLLAEYGTQNGEQEPHRVHLAVLKLSGGKVHELRKHLAIAKSDFRDVLAPAEYPGFWKIGFVGVDALSEKQVRQLVKDDWDQYHTWLNRD